jgi:hypothetical protein
MWYFIDQIGTLESSSQISSGITPTEILTYYKLEAQSREPIYG